MKNKEFGIFTAGLVLCILFSCTTPAKDETIRLGGNWYEYADSGNRTYTTLEFLDEDTVQLINVDAGKLTLWMEANPDLPAEEYPGALPQDIDYVLDQTTEVLNPVLTINFIATDGSIIPRVYSVISRGAELKSNFGRFIKSEKVSWVSRLESLGWID